MASRRRLLEPLRERRVRDVEHPDPRRGGRAGPFRRGFGHTFPSDTPRRGPLRPTVPPGTASSCNKFGPSRAHREPRPSSRPAEVSSHVLAHLARRLCPAELPCPPERVQGQSPPFGLVRN